MNSIKQTFVSGINDVPSNVQGVGDSAEFRQLSSTIPSMEPCLTPSIQSEGPTTGRDPLKRKTSDDDDVFGSSRAILPNTAGTSWPPSRSLPLMQAQSETDLCSQRLRDHATAPILVPIAMVYPLTKVFDFTNVVQ